MRHIIIINLKIVIEDEEINYIGRLMIQVESTKNCTNVGRVKYLRISSRSPLSLSLVADGNLGWVVLVMVPKHDIIMFSFFHRRISATEICSVAMRSRFSKKRNYFFRTPFERRRRFR